MKQHEVNVEVEMGDGPAPAAVEVTVTQGAVQIRQAELPPNVTVATFQMDEGDYVVHAQALVPRGTPVDACFAVPVGVRVR